MITKRDIGVALVAAACTDALLMARDAQKPVMASRAIVWDSLKVEATKVGASRQVFEDPTATLDELEMHITTLNGGQSPHPPHTHPDEELLIVKEGSIESLLDGKTTPLGPGGIIFHAANQPHTVRNTGTAPATYYVIKWNSPGMLKARQDSK
jgi:XRE family transcriptional regulator, regulator of sulfur utilization